MLNKKRLSVITSFFLSIFLVAGMGSMYAQNNDVVEVVNNSEDHTIFSELLAESGLNDVVSQEGPYTVVAPTDEAFEALGSELEEIRSNSERMQNVVIAHLFQGEVPAAEAESSLGIEIEEGDISASNGLVHTTSEVISTEQ